MATRDAVIDDVDRGADGEEAGASADAPPSKPPRFTRRMLLIASAVLLVLIGVTIAVLVLLGLDVMPTGRQNAAETAPAAEVEAETVFVEAPPMVINLRSADGSPRLVKLTVSLVPTKPAEAEAMKARLPLAIDSFQPFLRELRPEDLAGSAAVFRIKEELLVRANTALGAGSVRDVLILDLVQQ